MAAVAEHVELVEVFARRDVAQRECLADQDPSSAASDARPGSPGAQPRLNRAVAAVGVLIVLKLGARFGFSQAGPSVDRRLDDRRAESGLEKVEVAASLAALMCA